MSPVGVSALPRRHRLLPDAPVSQVFNHWRPIELFSAVEHSCAERHVGAVTNCFVGNARRNALEALQSFIPRDCNVTTTWRQLVLCLLQWRPPPHVYRSCVFVNFWLRRSELCEHSSMIPSANDTRYRVWRKEKYTQTNSKLVRRGDLQSKGITLINDHYGTPCRGVSPFLKGGGLLIPDKCLLIFTVLLIFCLQSVHIFLSKSGFSCYSAEVASKITLVGGIAHTQCYN